MRSVVGLLLAFIAAVFNGTFGVFAKDEVKGPDVDIFVFHFWASLGLACTGVLFLLFGPIVWTPMGVISGVLLVLSSACAFWAASKSLVPQEFLALNQGWLWARQKVVLCLRTGLGRYYQSSNKVKARFIVQLPETQV